MAQYIYYNSDNTEELNIIFPGSSRGFQTGLISKIFNKFVSEGRSALSYNYPFLDKGEENSSGDGLKEELDLEAKHAENTLICTKELNTPARLFKYLQ